MTNPAILVVYVNCPSKKEASVMGEAVVKAGLAACANVSGPVDSIYYWRGKLQKTKEYLLTLKTSKKNYPALEHKILQMHGDEVPSIIAVDAVKSTADFSRWVISDSKLIR